VKNDKQGKKFVAVLKRDSANAPGAVVTREKALGGIHLQNEPGNFRHIQTGKNLKLRRMELVVAAGLGLGPIEWPGFLDRINKHKTEEEIEAKKESNRKTKTGKKWSICRSSVRGRSGALAIRGGVKRASFLHEND